MPTASLDAQITFYCDFIKHNTISSAKTNDFSQYIVIYFHSLSTKISPSKASNAINANSFHCEDWCAMASTRNKVGGGEVGGVEHGSHVEASLLELRLDVIALSENHLRLHTALIPSRHAVQGVIHEQVVKSCCRQVVVQIKIYLAITNFRSRHQLEAAVFVGEKDLTVTFEVHIVHYQHLVYPNGIGQTPHLSTHEGCLNHCRDEEGIIGEVTPLGTEPRGHHKGLPLPHRRRQQQRITIFQCQQ